MLSGGPLHQSGDSPSADPRRMSALRVLTRHPVPVIAVADDGVVVFANTAFADVLSCSCDAVTSMSYEDICSFLPSDEILVAVTRATRRHHWARAALGEATLFVKMRRSATVGAADSGPVTLFEGLMERLSRLAAPCGAPLCRLGDRASSSGHQVRSATAPDNPHEPRGHTKSVALGGPVRRWRSYPAR